MNATFTKAWIDKRGRLRTKTVTDAKRVAELDARHARLYRDRKPHTRWLVFWRPKGSICWSPWYDHHADCSVITVYVRRSSARVKAQSVRKLRTHVCRPVQCDVFNEARVVKVALPK